jgi:hypothetical protein
MIEEISAGSYLTCPWAVSEIYNPESAIDIFRLPVFAALDD